jgi:hypothetical protein
MISTLRRGLLAVLLFFAMNAAFGQEEIPPPDPTEEDPQVPISALWILVAGGAAYGARKAYVAFRHGKR